MKKTLVLLGTLSTIFCSATQIHAASDNFSFRVSVNLPAAIANIAETNEIALAERNVTRGHPVDMFEEERMILGQRVIFKTSVLR